MGSGHNDLLAQVNFQIIFISSNFVILSSPNTKLHRFGHVNKDSHLYSPYTVFQISKERLALMTP